MSVIHLAGLGGHAFRSRAAPPIADHTVSAAHSDVSGFTLDEGVEVIMFDGPLLKAYLEGEQQCEQELVLLIQPTT